MELSFSEDVTVGYYVKIMYDILDDFFGFYCVVRFDSILVATEFKNKFVGKGRIMSNGNVWLKQYHKNLVGIQCSPKCVTTYNLIDQVITNLNDFWNDRKYEPLRFTQKIAVMNDYVNIIIQDLESDDDDKLNLYEIILDSEIKSDTNTLIYERTKYEELKSVTKRIENESDILTNQYLLASSIDLLLFPEIEKNCNKIEKKTIYNIASQRLDFMNKTFYDDPLNFVNKSEIIELFQQEELDKMQIEILNLNAEGFFDERFDKFNPPRQIAEFFNKFIYNNYYLYVMYLREQEQLGLI